jgi:hypothetical protein
MLRVRLDPDLIAIAVAAAVVVGEVGDIMYHNITIPTIPLTTIPVNIIVVLLVEGGTHIIKDV